jgi:hypothetical protein
MLSHKQINAYIGWSLSIITFFLYVATVAPGLSFWDSGEFIASAGKLQVGHPPGAPFYFLVARFFSIFSFGNPKAVAFLVNLLSVFSAALTVKIAYHTIVLLVSRFLSTKQSNSIYSKWVISGSAIIGALSLAVSISFWNAATEAEVYAFSLLITALVFWIILKWEQETDIQKQTKWLILISYLLGLTLGIHLLGLLCLPAIVLLVYFKQYKLTVKSAIIAVLIAILSPVIILNLYMPLLMLGAKWCDIFMVNSLSLPKNTGLIVFFLVLLGLLIWGIYKSIKYRNKLVHNALLALAMFTIGVSSYGIIIIRSSADTPINENNPEHIVNLISYLTREQYGAQPLFYGPMYNSALEKRNPYVEGKPIRRLTNAGYKVCSYSLDANYVKRDKRYFPRMWSTQPEHIAAYITWSGASNAKVPGYSENLKYFIRYQTGHMYLRYLMWNFVGRQNDLQGQGGPLRGNWISGIGFIDKARLGVAKNSVTPFKNAGTNVYFFLPFIIGLLGVLYQFKQDKKGFWIVFTLFVFTGFAIVVYLNQYPFQPRERDYSFLGSFYVFSLWIGLGVFGILSIISRLKARKYLIPLAFFLVFLAIPVWMLAQNLNDANHNHQTIANDLAYNILASCEPNAILFTNGDNDTFPLWYLQEIEGVRTDVRVVNISYLNMDWYIDQCRIAHYEAPPVPISVNSEKYRANLRTYNVVKTNILPFSGAIYNLYGDEIDRDFSLLLEKLMFTLDNSDFEEKNPEAYMQVVNEFMNISPNISNQRFLDLHAFVQELVKAENISGYNIRMDAAADLAENMNIFIQKQASFPLPLSDVLDFVFSDDEKNQANILLSTKKHNYVPGNIFVLPVEMQQLINTGTVSSDNIQYVVPRMEWKIDKEVLTKSDLIVLDIIRTNNWERPIYFVSTAGSAHYLGLEKYFTLEGMAYRLIPQITPLTSKEFGRTDPIKMYNLLTQEFKLDGFTKRNVYLDENMRRIGKNMRNMFSRAARDLYFAGEIEKAEEIIDLCLEQIPNDKVPYDYFSVSLVHGYYRINQKRKARELASSIADAMSKQLMMMLQLDDKYQQAIDADEKKILAVLQELARLAKEYQHKEYEKEITALFNSMYENYARKKGLYASKP